MKAAFSTILVFILSLCCTCISSKAHAESSSPTNMPPISQEIKIRMIFANTELIVALFDTPLSKEFISLLPFEAPFEDYAGVEKISSLPHKLSTQGTDNTKTAKNQQGDFCYYAPWGNLAVFYKGFGSGKELYSLGRIVSGKEKLADMRSPFRVRIERI